MPRYLYIEAYAEGVKLFGAQGDIEEPMLLVEQPDGSWRKAMGPDIVAMSNEFPNFFRSRPKPNETI
ncbi:MAG: hypothetical protein OXE57_14415 [Alphaproteobacteria bacterium]|nr:hypothetical protein [Alphaproteobacteria bacterium]